MSYIDELYQNLTFARVRQLFWSLHVCSSFKYLHQLTQFAFFSYLNRRATILLQSKVAIPQACSAVNNKAVT
jgi:hypothetical protein